MSEPLETSAGSACAKRVASICDQALGDLGGDQRDRVAAVRDRLFEPLRVAVAGRVKAGKSTLVNALVGQRVAPTAVEECTKVVTWFNYGVPERAELRLRSGERRALPLKDGRIPDPLGADIAGIESVHVYLSREPLRKMTLIDTPGLSSVNEQYSARTEGLLMDRASRTAAQHADALVVLMSQTARSDDAEVLESFRSLFRGTQPSPATAVGVLSRADQIGEGGDPLELARAIADRHARALRSVSLTVIPVVGLAAEASETHSLNERDARALELLASLGEAARERMLFSHEEFQDYQSSVSPGERRRLRVLLDLFALGSCLERIDAGVVGASALESHLRELSGIERLRSLLEETFTMRADALKANAALLVLARISWEEPGPGNGEALKWLRNAVEDTRLEPDMRSISEVWAVQAAAGNEVDLADELQEDLLRLIGQTTATGKLGLPSDAAQEAVAAEARKRAVRWRAFANSAAKTDTEERIGRVIYRSFEGLAQQSDGDRHRPESSIST